MFPKMRFLSRSIRLNDRNKIGELDFVANIYDCRYYPSPSLPKNEYGSTGPGPVFYVFLVKDKYETFLVYIITKVV